MKTIKHIILGIVILTMTMGSFNLSFGQGEVLFSETYLSGEVLPLFKSDRTFLDFVNTDQTTPQGALLGSCSASNAKALMDHLQSKKTQQTLPEDLLFVWDNNQKEGFRKLFALRLTNQSNSPDKQDIQTVTIKEGSNAGTYDLLVTFTAQGGKKWTTMTRENKDRNIAIVFEGEVVSAPKVTMTIKGGKCRISGDMSKEEAAKMKAALET